MWWVNNSGNLIDSFDLDRTSGDDDGAAWDPAATDRVLVVNGSTLYRIDARATLSSVCNTQLSSVGGMSSGPVPGQVLIADTNNDDVLFYDTDSCTLARTVSASAVPSFSGAAWDPTNNEIVAAGGGQFDGGLYFLEGTTGALVSTCRTAGTSVDWPSGVEMLPELDLIAVSSRTRDSWALLDRSCTPVHVRSTSVLADQVGSLSEPVDIGWLPAMGHFVATSNGNIGVAEFEGTARAFFQLRNDGQGSDGVAAIPGFPSAFLSIRYGTISRIDVPALADDPTISGRYRSAGAEFLLWDRGNGRVTGVALVNGDTLPLFGQLTDADTRLVLSTLSGTGAPLTVELAVSADLMTLTGPGPIGVLTRQ